MGLITTSDSKYKTFRFLRSTENYVIHLKIVCISFFKKCHRNELKLNIYFKIAATHKYLKVVII